MANYSIYFSPTGGTKKVADILAEHLFEEYQNIDLCKKNDFPELKKEDVCLVSVPSYGGRVPAIVLDRFSNISVQGTKVVLNAVYGNRDWEDTLSELQDVMERLGFVCVAAVAAVAEHSIFRQFAANRPDAEDRSELIGYAEQIRQKLKKNEFSALKLTGNHGSYKDYHGVPFKPEGNEKCAGCGLCVQECPAGAIDAGNPRITDKEKCISCMRCISICPKQARNLDAGVMEAMAEKMAPVLSGHKENQLFLECNEGGGMLNSNNSYFITIHSPSPHHA